MDYLRTLGPVHEVSQRGAVRLLERRVPRRSDPSRSEPSMRQTGRPVCRFFYPVETPRRRDCRRGERLAYILQEELKNTKMKLPILLTLCLLAGVVNPARPQARRTRTQTKQTRSADRERAKREQAVADSLAHLKALRSLDRLDFALEADRLTLRRGRVVFVSSDTNFVTLSGDMTTVQVAPFMGGGPNGIGGITLKDMPPTFGSERTSGGIPPFP